MKKQENFQSFSPDTTLEEGKETPRKELPSQKGLNTKWGSKTQKGSQKERAHSKGPSKEKAAFYPDITCYRWRQVGHYSKDCKAPPKEVEAPKPKKKTTPPKEKKLVTVPLLKLEMVWAQPENN